jgi:hypothetical protein
VSGLSPRSSIETRLITDPPLGSIPYEAASKSRSRTLALHYPECRQAADIASRRRGCLNWRCRQSRRERLRAAAMASFGPRPPPRGVVDQPLAVSPR